eukprot:3940996-Rhodomonas_salina.1
MSGTGVVRCLVLVSYYHAMGRAVLGWYTLSGVRYCDMLCGCAMRGTEIGCGRLSEMDRVIRAITDVVLRTPTRTVGDWRY